MNAFFHRSSRRTAVLVAVSCAFLARGAGAQDPFGALETVVQMAPGATPGNAQSIGSEPAMMSPMDRSMMERSRQFNPPLDPPVTMPELQHRTLPHPAPYVAPRYAPPTETRNTDAESRPTQPLYAPGFVHQNFQPPAYTSPIIHQRGRGYSGPISASPAVYPFAYGEYGGYGVSYFPYKSTFGSTQRYPYDGLNTYGPYVNGRGAGAAGYAGAGAGFAAPNAGCCQ